MKSLKRFLSFNNIIAIILPFFAIAIISTVLDMNIKSLLIFAVIFGSLLSTFIIAYPSLVLYFLLASTYIGVNLWSRDNLGVNTTDIFFPLFLLYYLVTIKNDNYKPLKELYKEQYYIILSYFVFILICIVSFSINIISIQAFYKIQSFWYLYRAIQLFVFFIFFFTYKKDNLHDSTWKMMNYIYFFQMFLIVFQYYIFNIVDDTGEKVQFGTLPSHHSVIAMYSVTMIPFLINEFYIANNYTKKTIYLLATMFSSYIIFLSESRSVLLGVLVSVLIFAMFSIRFNKKTFYLFMLLGCLAIIAWHLPVTKKVYEETFTHTTSTGIDISTYSRLFIWKGAWGSFQDASLGQKIFGQGIGLFSEIEFRNVVWSGGKGSTGAHNNLLHILVEVGILGLVFVIIHFVVILFFLFKKNILLSKLFAYATIALLVSGVTQETFWFQRAFGSFWLFYIILLALIFQEKNTNISHINTVYKI